ncbi:MAG: hypothetical protein OXE87_15655 [Chloroflexi bacterium]|nr:hypothetical protein [Chloroflexota bacterium]
MAIAPAGRIATSASMAAGIGSGYKVFGLSESQIARRVQAIARAAGLENWEFFGGHSGRVGMARRMAQNGTLTREIERYGRWKQGGGMVGRYTRGETAGSAIRYLCFLVFEDVRIDRSRACGWDPIDPTGGAASARSIPACAGEPKTTHDTPVHPESIPAMRRTRITPCASATNTPDLVQNPFATHDAKTGWIAAVCPPHVLSGESEPPRTHQNRDVCTPWRLPGFWRRLVSRTGETATSIDRRAWDRTRAGDKPGRLITRS